MLTLSRCGRLDGSRKVSSASLFVQVQVHMQWTYVNLAIGQVQGGRCSELRRAQSWAALRDDVRYTTLHPTPGGSTRTFGRTFLGTPLTGHPRASHLPPPAGPCAAPVEESRVRVSSHATLVCGECASGLVAQTVTRSALYAHRTVWRLATPMLNLARNLAREEGLSNKEIHDAFRLPRTQRFGYGFASIDMPIAIEHRSRVTWIRSIADVVTVVASTERRL